VAPATYDILTPQNPETLLLSRISKAKLSVLNPLLRGRFTSILHKLRNNDVDCVFMSVFIHRIPKTDGQQHHLLLSQERDTGVFGVALSLALTQEILIVGLTVDQTECREYDQCKREQLHGWLLASYL
jgi:hypothetical protein